MTWKSNPIKASPAVLKSMLKKEDEELGLILDVWQSLNSKCVRPELRSNYGIGALMFD